MIKKFGCKNIKAIRKYSEIEIRPITILMGENSSGKSSMLQGLSLLAVNKMFGNDIKRIKYNNPFSNFGNNDTFKNEGEDIILNFEIEDEDSQTFYIQLHYIDEKLNNEYGLLKTIFINYEEQNDEEADIIINYENDKIGYAININIHILDSEMDEISFYTDLKSIQLYADNKYTEKYLIDIMDKEIPILKEMIFKPLKKLIESLEAIRHIGVLKDIKATYDYPNDYIGYFGEKYKSVAKSLSSKAYINRAIRNIFEYEIKKIDKNTGNFYLSDSEINKPLTLNMFGSSLNSTIPILTQYAKNNEKTIRDKYRLTIIEEPEINEHPLSQARFIEALFPKNRPKKHFNIIETHSDHIINKFRYLVAKKIIKHNDIVIYYKHKNSTNGVDKDKFYKIEIDKCGQFISDDFGKGGFPKGFFDATLDDLFSLSSGC